MRGNSVVFGVGKVIAVGGTIGLGRATVNHLIYANCED